MSALTELLATLYHPELATIDLKLERVQQALDRLDNPEKKLPPTIHVAGTNGKGSTIAFARALLEAAGKRVHVYTSPHLVRFNERIVLNGGLIADEYLIALLERVKALAIPLTFFEITTLAALLAFAQHQADALLLETGMGGRLDATNIVRHPAVCVITPISLDHQSYLGDTIEKIAREKAGIIKSGSPVIIGRQRPEVLALLASIAKERGAPTYLLGKDFQPITAPLALHGMHQQDNAAVALAAANKLSNISAQAQRQAWQHVCWPGRLQRLPDMVGNEIWLDGGHNAEGSEILAAFLKTQNQPPTHFICAMLQGKDSAAYFQAIKPYVASMQTIGIPHETTAQTAQELAQAARKAGIEAQTAESVAEALARAAKNPHAKRIMIAGSLYLAGYVLAQLA